jgi:hypothetical protein
MSPYKIETPAVIANSGGKTSGYNLWQHLQDNGGTLPDNAVCLFNNTGWEHNLTLDFLAEQQSRWSVEIVWAEFCRRPATPDELAAKKSKASAAAERLVRMKNEPVSFFAKRIRPAPTATLFDTTLTSKQAKTEAVRKAKKFATACWESYLKAELIGIDHYRRVTRDTASIDGRPFNELLEGLEKFRREVKQMPGVLPNGVQRICTGHLKVRSAATLAADLWPHLKRNDFECRLGLRADEEVRVFAAREWGRDGGRATFPLYDAGVVKADIAAFWASQPFGLKLKSYEGNCGGCYMKRAPAIVNLIRNEFFDIAWWQGWEERTGQRFRKERSYRGLETMARTQLELIPPDDFDNAITCEGGYCSD